jgi:hypothetical protein
LCLCFLSKYTLIAPARQPWNCRPGGGSCQPNEVEQEATGS